MQVWYVVLKLSVDDAKFEESLGRMKGRIICIIAGNVEHVGFHTAFDDEISLIRYQSIHGHAKKIHRDQEAVQSV